MKEKILNLLPPKVYLELKRRKFKWTCRTQFDRMQRLRTVATDHGYTYKPFDDTKSIFVHIPKCAGVSVSKAIFGSLAGGHATLNDYINVFEPKCILTYFKFTIVRNPWDRLVSAYFFLKNGGFNEKDRDWFNQELGSFPDFEAFVMRWLSRANIWKWHHFRPQYYYLLERREKIMLDFIGFLENIEDDFKYIVNRVGTARALPVSNVSAHTSFLDHYTRDMRNVVADVYSEDVKMLGYSFTNSSLSDQVAKRNAGKMYTLKRK